MNRKINSRYQVLVYLTNHNTLWRGQLRLTRTSLKDKDCKGPHCRCGLSTSTAYSTGPTVNPTTSRSSLEWTSQTRSATGLCSDQNCQKWKIFPKKTELQVNGSSIKIVWGPFQWSRISVRNTVACRWWLIFKSTSRLLTSRRHLTRSRCRNHSPPSRKSIRACSKAWNECLRLQTFIAKTRDWLVQ